MRFASSLGKAGTPTAATSGAVRRSIPQPDWNLGKPYSVGGVGGDVDSFVRDTFERVTWVFAAVRAVAHNSARLKVKVLRDDPETGEAITNHPLLPLLNYQASEFSKEQAYVFRHRVSATLELSKKGCFIEVTKNRRGEVKALSLLPPRTVSPIPDALSFVSGYEVRIGGVKVAELSPDQVLWLKQPHPLDPFRSMTSFEASGMTIDTDWLAHLYNANFMRNDGRGGGVLGVRGPMDDEDMDEMNAWMKGGVERAGQWRVIDEVEGLDFADFSTTPRDAQYVELRKLSKEEIFTGAGVPESVAGNASGRTWDNADVEKDNFWNEKMLGHLELVGGGYDMLDGDPNTFVVHDTSRVPVLQRAKNEDLRNKREEVMAGVRSIDSYLVAAGEEPFGVPATMVPLTSIGVGPLFTVGLDGKLVDEAPPAPTPETAPLSGDNVPAPATNGNTAPANV